MSEAVLRLLLVIIAVTVLSACGEKKEDGDLVLRPTGGAYGREDGECFAGIVREADARHMKPDDLRKWKDSLDARNKEWFQGFSGFYSKVAPVVMSHMFTTHQELYGSGLITRQQLEVLKGYTSVSEESDGARAHAMAASACAVVGFAPGPDLK